MKRSWSILLVVTLLVMSLLPCAAMADEEFVFGFDAGNRIYPYCAKFADYMVEIGEAEGIKVLTTDCAGDVATQINYMENFIISGANVIGAIYQDGDGTAPVVDVAKAADNMPIISTLTEINVGNEYENYIYVGSRNYDGGYLMGEWMAANLPENCGIWYLYSRPGDTQADDRYNGMLDALKDNGRDDVTVVSRMDADNLQSKGVTIMEDWMQAYDKIDCVAGCNDDSVLGAIEAAKAAGRMDDGTIFIGLDGSDPALASIKAGEMSMSVLQDAKAQVIEVINVVKQLRDGTPASEIEDVFVPFAAITAENVDEYMS